MKLLAILVVLALRRLELSWPEWLQSRDRISRGVSPWWALLGKKSSWWHWGLAVLLPTLVVAAIFYLLQWVAWGLFGWLLGIALLLWLWGGASEFRQIDQLLVLGRLHNQEALEQQAERLFDVSPGDDFYKRLQRRFLLRDARVVFASIFWLVLLGYWAAFLYLLNRIYIRHLQPTSGGFIERLDYVLFYPVSRLLVLCIALASDFNRVTIGVKGHWLDWPGERLLSVAMYNAFSVSEEDKVLTTELEKLERLHTLLLRALALWLVMAAVFVMLVP